MVVQLDAFFELFLMTLMLLIVLKHHKIPVSSKPSFTGKKTVGEAVSEQAMKEKEKEKDTRIQVCTKNSSPFPWYPFVLIITDDFFAIMQVFGKSDGEVERRIKEG